MGGISHEFVILVDIPNFAPQINVYFIFY